MIPFDEANETFETYLERLENYLEMKGLDSSTSAGNKSCVQTLINCLSPKQYQVLSSLTTPDLPKNGKFKELCTLLKQHLCPKLNETFEQHKFVSRVQLPNESLTDFVQALKSQTRHCGFVCEGCKKSTNNAHLKTQFIRGVKDVYIRERLLQAKVSTFQDLVSIALDAEASHVGSLKIQTEVFTESDVDVVHAVNRPRNQSARSCLNCGGQWPHKSLCPAKNKTCYKCSRMQSSNKGFDQVRYLEDGDGEDVEDEVHEVRNVRTVKTSLPTVSVNLCGSTVEFCIDTGSSVNIIDESTYRRLKRRVELQHTDCKLFPYQSEQNLEVVGKFNTHVTFKNESVLAEIFVVQNRGQALMSSETATGLGLIKFFYSIDKPEDIFSTHPKLFTGIGKLKGEPIRLHVDPSVQPIAITNRRVPIHWKPAVEAEVKRLEEADIIEKVNDPSPWVSPVVLVPRASNPDVPRMCIDMREPNKAIQRTRHVIPTIEDIISEIGGAVWFSKVDLNDGYLQLELCPESRGLTTFSTHMGLWRYKRLVFGINSAAEIFNDRIRWIIRGISGVVNVMDDIIITGRTREEHDARLNLVLRALENAGLTLNKKKCQFYLTEVEYFGFIFSEKGFRPSPSKLSAFEKLEPPKTVSEVRSVLGMINYCGRFIPNLASLSSPLRELTKKGKKFMWTKIENDAFLELKSRLKNHVSNAYFNTNREIHLLVDAGPEGLGAILAQPSKDSMNIVACASVSLTPTQKRYSQVEREMLAVCWGVEHFSVYLKGGDFKHYLQTTNLSLVFSSRARR
ncbi:hypothetical protein WDU94_005574 [Cyamophila willieti]